ncbi:MAG TPA: 5-bromo-4-chloroindolyl phosphate hydrolysis family protein [Candidatus Limnocylindria bacterium]|nr:5-bromo-4-chloroindolyl phosphate hydrolysis family protein [Candidatus Limnocylindria bacterium]
MARKNSQSTSPGSGLFAGLLAAGGTLMLYSVFFNFHRGIHYLIGGALAALVGRVAYIMFSGLDTSKKAPSVEDLPVTGNEAVDRLVKRGQEMLAQIRHENELIPDPVLSARIDELEGITGRIFRTVIEQPGKAPQIRRFMDYYLPTTLKMLTGYRKLTERGVTGESARETKARIEQAMQVVLGAFKKQLETLYQNDMLDISTDIDVLETMLKQDSLLASDFGPGVRQGSSGASGASAAQQQKEE